MVSKIWLKITAITVGVFLLSVLCDSNSAKAMTISSTFDTDRDGWTIGGNGASTVPDHITTGGNPGGYIRDIDASPQGWDFQAPSKFHGDQSIFFDGFLTLDINTTIADIDRLNSRTLILNSDGILGEIGFTLPLPTSGVWTSYKIAFNDTAGWEKNIGGSFLPASNDDIKAILSRVTHLSILGDWHNGTETTALDNVAFVQAQSTPEPSTLLSLGLIVGLGGLSLKRKQKKSAEK
ncbi:MAG: laminin B domain-containing protein [Xenococcaceae cyanobacterium]